MADSDKLYNRTGTWGDSTLGDGDPVTPAYLGGVDTNALLLGRNRYTGGADVLAQPDCEIGATWAGPDGTLWFYRLDGTAVSDDATRAGLATPLRGIWHYDDRSGAPETDGRSINGDLIIWDDGTNDRFLGVCTGAGVYGLGVRADYRTAATALSTTQNSDAVAWRASRWVTSAAKYRQWRAVARADASNTLSSFLSLYAKQEEGSEYKVFDFQHQTGSGATTKFYIYGDGAGSIPALGFTADPAGISPGSISCVFGPNGTDIDGTAVWFKHGDSTRHVRWRYFGVDDETTGTGAEVLAVTYQQAASGGETTKRSPSFVHRAAAWDGAASVELAHYSQLVPTSDTAGYVEHGFDFGSGVYQFHHDGLLGIAGSSTGGILLSRYTAATGGAQLVDSSLLKFRGAYWNGAASADIDATTKLVTDATTPSGHLRTTFSSGVGLLDLYDDGTTSHEVTTAATGGAKIVDSPRIRLRGHSWDGAASVNRDMGIRCLVGSSADEADVWAIVYDNGTTDAGGVSMDGTRVVGDAAANVLAFQLGAGTHPAVQSGTTKTTPGGVDAWMVVDVNGTTYYSPLYTSKTA